MTTEKTPSSTSVDSLVMRLRNYSECHDGDVDEAANALAKIAEAWTDYKSFLMQKYPVNEGEEWQFTCPHHRRIDAIVNA